MSALYRAIYTIITSLKNISKYWLQGLARLIPVTKFHRYRAFGGYGLFASAISGDTIAPSTVAMGARLTQIFVDRLRGSSAEIETSV